MSNAENTTFFDNLYQLMVQLMDQGDSEVTQKAQSRVVHHMLWTAVNVAEKHLQEAIAEAASAEARLDYELNRDPDFDATYFHNVMERAGARQEIAEKLGKDARARYAAIVGKPWKPYIPRRQAA